MRGREQFTNTSPFNELLWYFEKKELIFLYKKKKKKGVQQPMYHLDGGKFGL
jgi:hypothetical protein